MDRNHGSAAPVSRGGTFALRVLVLAAAAILPFLPGLRSPFFFDDLNTVTQNLAIGSMDLPRFFTDPSAFSVKTGNWPYRPLVLVVNALLVRWFGLGPLPWHLFQVLIHFMNSVLVMMLAQRVFGLGRGALIAAALFAVAPLQTQAALYVSARSMVQALGPALIAVMASVKALDPEASRRRLWFSVAVAAAFLAFFSSEGALALMLWLPLGFYAWGRKVPRRNAAVLLSGIFLAAAIYFLARLAFSPGPLLGGHPGIKPPFTFSEHLVLQLETPLLMFRLLVFPVHLSLLHFAAAGVTLADSGALVSILALLIGLIATIIFRRSRPLAAGIGWYVVSLLPAVLVPLNIPWAEHRSYLALPGLAIAIGYLLEKTREGLRARGRAFASGLAGLMLCLLALGSFQRARQWRSPTSIFRDAASKAPEYDVPWNFLAVAAYEKKDYPRALGYLDLAIARNPYFADPFNTRANCLIQLERLTPALESARAAVKLEPANATYWNTLAVIYMMQERWAEAEVALQTALQQVAPHDPNRRVLERNWRELQKRKREKG